MIVSREELVYAVGTQFIPNVDESAEDLRVCVALKTKALLPFAQLLMLQMPLWEAPSCEEFPEQWLIR